MCQNKPHLHQVAMPWVHSMAASLEVSSVAWPCDAWPCDCGLLVARSTSDQWVYDYEISSAPDFYALLSNPTAFQSCCIKKGYPLAKFVVLHFHEEMSNVFYYECCGYQNVYSIDQSMASVYLREAGCDYVKYHASFPGRFITDDPTLLKIDGVDTVSNRLYPEIPLGAIFLSDKSHEEQVLFALHMARDYPDQSKYYVKLLDADKDESFTESFWMEVLRGLV